MKHLPMTLVFLGIAACAHEQPAPPSQLAAPPPVVESSALQPPAAAEPAPAEAPSPPLAEPAPPLSTESIYFDFGKSTLTAQAKAALARFAPELAKHPELQVTIQAHCDEREANDDTLGRHRAGAARKALRHLGVRADQIKAINYGKANPLASGHDDASWSQNRRDDFVISRQATAQVGARN